MLQIKHKQTPISLEMDSPTREILKFLIKENVAYFNQLSRELSKAGVASRKTIFGKLLSLEESGILVSKMKRLPYGETDIQRWVKEYHISEGKVDRLKKLLI